MTPVRYKSERQLRGTQEEVAALLGVDRTTIARREIGMLPITKESWLALCALKKNLGSGESHDAESCAPRS